MRCIEQVEILFNREPRTKDELSEANNRWFRYGMQLPTVGGLELQICLGSIVIKSNTKRPICTIQPIEGRCCYGLLNFNELDY